jgi:hypothetical protein
MHKPFSTPDATWAEPLMVTINGKEYPTQLYDGVQRFVGNGAVDFMVEASMKAGYALNDLVLAVLHGEVSLEDYIVFFTLKRGSLGHFVDSLGSLIDFNPEIFPGGVDAHLQLVNPLWEEEDTEGEGEEI